jgi:hypothetical protein
MLFPGLYGGLQTQNLPYKFKNRMVISTIATSENLIELLRLSLVRSETRFVILSKFWSIVL